MLVIRSFAPLCVAASLSFAAPLADGVFQTRVGAIQITVLQDGVGTLPIALLKGIEPAKATELLGGRHEAPIAMNAYLLEIEGKRILVDTGTGPNPKGDGGHLMARLAATKIDPATIDTVLITHFHYDHVGGLTTADGTRAFPKALVRVAQAEHDQWLGAPDRLPDPLKTFLPLIKKNLAPYQAAGAYKPFAPGEAPAPGVTALPAPGHTAGHTVYVCTSQGQTLWCIGDLMHIDALQFTHPEVGLSFDTDGAQAVATRRLLFQRAAKAQVILAGAHAILPCLGRIVPQGAGYTFKPLANKP